jgi:dihydropteroate synthase
MRIVTDHPVRKLECREQTLELGARTLIMGILNVTPDSFSDGGKYNRVQTAVAHARQMVADGADLIDIGGESTRPGYQPVSLEEELRRVIPVVEALRNEIDVPLSIDTCKAEVARQALDAGAHIINDQWGFKQDPAMAATVARYGCPCILMHNRPDRDYGDFIGDVLADLRESADIAMAAGVARDMIILDPGIGFAKDYRENLYLMKHLDQVAALGYPVLLGTSRKSTIRKILGGLPADDVVEGTAATVVLGIAQGCGIMRVHDVKAIKKAAVMADAVIRAQLPAKEGRANG